MNGPGVSLGIWRVAPDGANEELVMPPVPDPRLGVTLHGLTPDGNGLVWGRLALEGASLETYVTTTGARHSFGAGLARALSFRATDPRALVLRYSGDGPGELVVWSDETGQVVRTLAGPEAQVRGGSWSPDGRQLVVALGSRGGGSELVRMDEQGGRRMSLASDAASDPIWLDDLIVYLRSDGDDPRRTAVAVMAAGGERTPLILYRGEALSDLTVVR